MIFHASHPHTPYSVQPPLAMSTTRPPRNHKPRPFSFHYHTPPVDAPDHPPQPALGRWKSLKLQASFLRLRHNSTNPPSLSETPSNRISAPLENPQLGVDSELSISPIEEVLAAKRPSSQIYINSASSLSSVSIASTDTPPPPQVDELKLRRLSLQQQARNQPNLPILYTPSKSNSSRNTYFSSTTSRESLFPISKDSISGPIPQPEVLSPTLEMHLNQPDSLTVDVMKLPKVLHNAPALPNIVAPPPTSSARSSVMSVIPPMHNVWLDDDDDDFYKDRGASKMDLFSRKSIIRAKHRSTTSVNNSVWNASGDDVSQTNTTTTGAKRRNRMSFGFGREYGNESPTGVDKLKKSLSTRGHSRIRLDPLIDSPIRPTIAPEPEPEPLPAPESGLEPYVERQSTPSSSERSQPTLALAQPSKLASPATPKAYRLSTASKFPSASLSTKSSARTLASASQQQNNTTKRSTASKLLSLLTSKPGKLASKVSMDSSLTPATTATAATATHPQALLTRSKISAPLNFTHTAHVGGAQVKRNSGISVSGAPPLKLVPPSRPDRQSETYEIPLELGGPGGSAAGLSCSSVSSLQRSSFGASPNTYCAAADNISISTVSVDEAGLSSSPPPFGATGKQLPAGHHRLFFSRLNTSNGSRSSLAGSGGGASGGGDTGSDDASSSNGLASWQSVDSLRSDHRASLSAQQQQMSTSPARYSLPPSTISAGLGPGSYRARSRLSVHSTISIDSAASLSYLEMDSNTTPTFSNTTTGNSTSNANEGLGLLPAPSMGASGPGSGPGSVYGGPAPGYGYALQQQQQQQQRGEYSTASIPLDKVREEGWF